MKIKPRTFVGEGSKHRPTGLGNAALRAAAYQRAMEMLATTGAIFVDDWTHGEWCSGVWKAIQDWKIGRALVRPPERPVVTSAPDSEGWMS